MGSFVDLTGKVFERLTVLSRNQDKKGVYWDCVCECGKQKTVRGSHLTGGKIRSCGCLQKQHESLVGKQFGNWKVLERLENLKTGGATYLCLCECGAKKVHQASNLTNGATVSCGCMEHPPKVRPKFPQELSEEFLYNYNVRDKLRNSWAGILRRCLDPSCPAYEKYGKQGITVCEEWVKSFEQFCNDMGKPPSKIHSVDRINPDKGYCKQNCRWATPKEQARNRKSNIIICYQGEEKCLLDWCNELGANYESARKRLKSGMSFEEAIKLPVS